MYFYKPVFFIIQFFNECENTDLKNLIMKKPLGKKTMSYVKDILLEKTGSDYNEVLEVYLSKGRYQLCTSGAIYSYEDKYVNFLNIFNSLNWEKLNIERVLVLGLGLASVPQMLEQRFKKDLDYYAVEIDPEIIRLANKYILSELKSPIQIFEMDAEIFVEVSDEMFDMIIIDIFDNNVIPEKFESEEFLRKTSQLLSDEGIILFNRLNIDDKTYQKTMDYNEKVFKELFPFAKSIFIKDNIILCNRDDVWLEN